MTIDIAVRHRFAGFELDAAFRVAKPGVTALFGPSGAGKTTIANAVAGLFRPQVGRIALEDRIVFDSGAGIFVPPRARRIGYVFQEARLFPHMSVAGNLRFGWRRAVPRPGADAFAHVVDLLGLEHLLSRKPAKLSGGEKGRVALGRALLASPTLLLLDEPLAALDAARKAEIFPYLEKLRDEARLPMIYVTHSLDEVTRLADELIFVKEGRVAAQGAVFDYFEEVRKTIELANQELFFIDPYLDAHFVSQYMPFVRPGVVVRLLTSDKKLGTLLPAVDAFSRQYGRALNVRSATGFHDRFVFVDKGSCYQSGASFKDGAKSAPTTFTQITDAFSPMLQTYENLWASAKLER